MFRVLVVDDTKSVHAFVRSLCATVSGVELKPAMNGAEALEIIKKDPAFDVILLDWEMPILNGPDTLKALREMKSAVPVIMMTTKSAPEEIAAMLSSGAAEYLMKPFTADILFEKIAFSTGKDISNAA